MFTTYARALWTFPAHGIIHLFRRILPRNRNAAHFIVGFSILAIGVILHAIAESLIIQIIGHTCTAIGAAPIFEVTENIVSDVD